MGLYVKTQTICLANIFVHFYRFNWGLCVRRLSQRILKLLANKDFLKEERERARHLSHGIQGFGSFNQRSSAINERLHDTPSKIYGRCNSDYGEKYEDFTILEKKLENNSNSGEDIEEQHPFVDQEKLTTTSLLSV